MKKIYSIFFLVFSLAPYCLFATEKLEKDQYYYKSYYRNYWTGKNLVVAVIDDGVWQWHPDLKWSEWLNKKEIPGNWIDDDKNGYIDDYFGFNFVDNSFDVTPKWTHGTAVAGIIWAQINESWIAWLAPDAKIMSLIACGEISCSFENVRNAIYYAVDNGANLINLSLWGSGYVGFNSNYDDVIEYAYNKWVVVVVSAWNGDPESAWVYGQDLDQVKVSPVCNDKNGINMVIGVGATHSLNNNKTLWSNFGSCVDTWAQGVNVTSTTDPKHNDGYFYDSTLSGTSFSAPIITGIAAILKSSYPELTPLELIDLISSSIDPSDMNELSKMKDARQCIIRSFNLSVKNGGKILISGQHFRSHSSFSLVKIDSEGKQINVIIDKWVQVLDADLISLDTSLLNLSEGVYSLTWTNNTCKNEWNSITIEWGLTYANKTIPKSSSASPSNTPNSLTEDSHILSEAGIIMKQDNESAYRLNDNVLRQEVIGMAVKIWWFSLPDNYSCRKLFSDVTQTKPNNWACRAVEVSADNWIISRANSIFRPEENITRAEALAILLKAANIQIQEYNGISKYSDTTLAWQINVVNTALSKWIIDGTENFYPNRPATRGEIFNMARRILEQK